MEEKAGPKVSIEKLAALIPDNRNANKGTERGAYQIRQSLRKYGAGRSILVDKNNRIIAGNKTTDALFELEMDDAIIVDSDGTRPVVVRRVDVDLDSQAGRELAIADNRTSEIDLEWDAEELARLQLDGIDLTEFWTQDELDKLVSDALALPDDVRDDSARFDDAKYSILIECKSESDQLQMLERFQEEGLTCRALIV